METSQKGLDFIKQFEGIRKKAYLDSVNIPTIGVGHTGPEVYMGMEITDEQVDEYLKEDVKEAENAVNKFVEVDLSQDQFDALVSFTFNLGSGNLQQSTLLKKVNAGDTEGASQEFQKWNRAGGKVVVGLTKRRLGEADLFRGEWNA